MSHRAVGAALIAAGVGAALPELAVLTSGNPCLIGSPSAGYSRVNGGTIGAGVIAAGALVGGVMLVNQKGPTPHGWEWAGVGAAALGGVIVAGLLVNSSTSCTWNLTGYGDVAPTRVTEPPVATPIGLVMSAPGIL